MGDINHAHRCHVDPVIMVIRPPLLEWWGHRSATTWLLSGVHSLKSAAFCPISIQGKFYHFRELSLVCI